MPFLGNFIQSFGVAGECGRYLRARSAFINFQLVVVDSIDKRGYERDEEILMNALQLVLLVQ